MTIDKTRLEKLHKLRAVILKDVRIRYARIEQPRKGKYGAQLIFTPDGDHHKRLLRAMQAAFMIKFPGASWKDRLSDGYAMPIRLGNSDFRKGGAPSKDPILKNKAFMNCNNTDPVSASGSDGRKLNAPYQRTHFYDGATVIVRVEMYGYEPAKNGDTEGATSPGITGCITNIMPGTVRTDPFPSAQVNLPAEDVFKEFIKQNADADDEFDEFDEFNEFSQTNTTNKPVNQSANNLDEFDDDIPF